MSAGGFDFSSPLLRTRGEVSAAAGDPFVLPGLVHSTVTGVFAPPKVGKSALVAHVAATALGRGETLGRSWIVRPERVLFVCTDPDGAVQYHRRISDLGVVPDRGTEMAFADAPEGGGWRELSEAARPDSKTLVVLDHLTDLAGDLIDGVRVGEVFQAIEREFVRRGSPVIVIGHMSDGQPVGWSRRKRPMGNTAIAAKCRNLVFLEDAGGGSRLRVTTRGGDVPDEEGIVLDWGSLGAADLRLVDQTTRSATKAKRAHQTLERNARMSDFVVSSCQDLTHKTDVARRLVTEFGGSIGSVERMLQPSGALGELVAREASGWVRKVPA